MRAVRVTEEGIKPDITEIHGTDAATGELVTFKLNDPGFVLALIAVAKRDGFFVLPLADFQIVSVEPVSGDWDSPGTSPEDGA